VQRLFDGAPQSRDRHEHRASLRPRLSSAPLRAAQHPGGEFAGRHPGRQACAGVDPDAGANLRYSLIDNAGDVMAENAGEGADIVWNAR
jgi:hypothetical protein